MELIKEALTFDDILLLPRYSEVLPSETNLNISLSKNIELKIPFLTAAMDTVTESNMARAISKEGGLGIIHRNLTPDEQCLEVKKTLKNGFKVGAAIGTSEKEIIRAKKLTDNGVNLIVVDTAHGHSRRVLSIIKRIKKLCKGVSICAGNIATGEAAKRLYNEGVDIVKVGIGPGSICTTRLVAGIGVPQITAIMNVKKVLEKKNVKIISDGGIKFSGDLVKALAAGADAIMMGSIFAGTEETPGKKFKYKNKFYKKFRGMGSIGAMSDGSSDRYFQSDVSKKSKFVPEGVEGIIRYKGPVSKIIYRLKGGLRSSMGYIGAKKISQIRSKSKFVKITKAGFYESMVHNVEISESEAKFKLWEKL